MNFIELHDGRLLNTAFIRAIQPTEELCEFLFEMADGVTVRGTIDHHDIGQTLSTVIPAEKGYRAVVAPIKDGFKREWNHLPVLAWRVSVAGMEPIIPGGNKLHGLVGIIEPSGQVVGHDGTKYASLTVFREEIEADDTRFLDMAQKPANDDVKAMDPAADILPGYHMKDNPYPSRDEIVFQVETTLVDRVEKELVLILFCNAIGTGSPFRIDIVLESPIMDRQEQGQKELSMLCSSVGIVQITDSEQLHGKCACVRRKKNGKLKFAAHNLVAEAA